MAASNDQVIDHPTTGRSPLPFVGRVAPVGGGWSVFVPVSAEHCEVERQTVEYERVSVRLDQAHDIARVSARVRREELAIDAEERARRDRPTVRIRRAPYFDDARDRE